MRICRIVVTPTSEIYAIVHFEKMNEYARFKFNSYAIDLPMGYWPDDLTD